MLVTHAFHLSCRSHTLGMAFVVVVCAAYSNVSWANPDAAETTQLDSIVVTASATERLVADAPASVMVLTGEELRRRPIYDLADAVEGSPGVSLTSVGVNAKGISIRGMKTDHTLILYDGMRVSQSGPLIYGSDFEHGWVPAEAIERVEVVRGPMSSLYGSEALGGVVNVISRSATDKWVNVLSADGVFPSNSRGGDRHRTSVYLSGPLVQDVLGLTVSGEYQYRQEFYTPEKVSGAAFHETSIGNQKSFMGNVGLTWTPDARQRLSAAISTGREDRWRNSEDYRSNDDIRRQRLSLSHTGDWGWGKSDVKLYRTQLKRINDRTDGLNTGPHEFTDEVANGMVSVKPLSWHTVTLGGELRRETVADPTVNTSGEVSATHKALFIQDEMMLGESWELLLGGRYDNHPNYGGQISPRTYLLYHYSDDLVFKGGVGKGFRAPTLKQLSPEYQASFAGGSTISGNPNLNPETSVSYEAGFSYSGAVWQASAMGFLNQIKDLIASTCVLNCDKRIKQYEYMNIDRARIRGMELGLGVQLPRQFRLDTNYTLLDAIDSTTRVRLNDRSRHTANATLTWEPAHDWNASFRVQYIGSQNKAPLRPSEPQGYRPAYTMLSLYGSHDFSRAVTVRAGIENITDKRLADESDLYEYADEGRRVYLNMEVRF